MIHLRGFEFTETEAIAKCGGLELNFRELVAKRQSSIEIWCVMLMKDLLEGIERLRPFSRNFGFLFKFLLNFFLFFLMNWGIFYNGVIQNEYLFGDLCIIHSCTNYLIILIVIIVSDKKRRVWQNIMWPSSHIEIYRSKFKLEWAFLNFASFNFGKAFLKQFICTFHLLNRLKEILKNKRK